MINHSQTSISVISISVKTLCVMKISALLKLRLVSVMC